MKNYCSPPEIAIMYDFDKTLSPKEMQEYSFIENVGMSPESFWNESNSMAAKFKMDRILAYMYQMIVKARAAQRPIHRQDFVDLGKDIGLFPGVEEWFGRMENFGKEHGVEIKHYIISSGLKEIIEGTKIAGCFEEIFACEFHYDVNGVADWPAMAVNYTAKTQFLFRINKGVLDVSNDTALNDFVEENSRPVPFRNMIYIGDGMTDVPCMKLVKTNGGKSIAVHQENKSTACSLLKSNRVDFIAGADYSAGSELDKLVCAIICQMASTNLLIEKSTEQRNSLEQLS